MHPSEVTSRRNATAAAVSHIRATQPAAEIDHPAGAADATVPVTVLDEAAALERRLAKPGRTTAELLTELARNRR